ncbi:MAG: hypothetical protein AAF637_13575, partial [Pseudomonadota bacterium]
TGMCEAFLLPYNRKMWKRPLEQLASTGFQWTITSPDHAEVRRGLETPDWDFRAYNADGWYPRPAAGAPVRGMACLSQALARQVTDLRLQRRIVSIDVRRREVVAETSSGNECYRWRRACLATLPLPECIRLCPQAPSQLRHRTQALLSNRVVMVYLAIRGSRPSYCGHWRYYADESVLFNRLVYMHAFDPLTAPAHGWGLMAEITQRAEDPEPDLEVVCKRTVDDIRRVGALRPTDDIVMSTTRIVDPAYVVFTRDNAEVASEARSFLTANGITPLGRYGNWEYSSMAQVMRDGFAWGSDRATELSYLPPQRTSWRSLAQA